MYVVYDVLYDAYYTFIQIQICMNGWQGTQRKMAKKEPKEEKYEKKWGMVQKEDRGSENQNPGRCKTNTKCLYKKFNSTMLQMLKYTYLHVYNRYQVYNTYNIMAFATAYLVSVALDLLYVYMYIIYIRLSIYLCVCIAYTQRIVCCINL